MKHPQCLCKECAAEEGLPCRLLDIHDMSVSTTINKSPQDIDRIYVHLFDFFCNFEMCIVSLLSDHKPSAVRETDVVIGCLWFV